MTLTGEYSLKGIAINLALSCLFVTPVLAYILKDSSEHLRVLLYANVAFLTAIFLLPPWGWKKPHPYSDQQHLRRSPSPLAFVPFLIVVAITAWLSHQQLS